MSRALALLRPEPGWSASAGAARALALTVSGHPIAETVPVEWSPPDQKYDALLIGSAASFAHGGAGLARLRDVPVHAVGVATAAAARAAGFRVTAIGESGLQGLLDARAGSPVKYLRLGGEERVPLSPHPGQAIAECIVYRLRPLPVASDFARQIAEDAPLIALHSAAAARHFRAELLRIGVRPDRLHLLALGARIAAAAGPGWAGVHCADRPDDAALLAKAVTLCK